MPTLTVVAGANGAGKSTLTRMGREAFQEMVVLDPDVIAKIEKAAGGSRSTIDAGRAVLSQADELAARKSFLVETTLSGNMYLRMMTGARAAGYLNVLLYVGTADVSINLQRVRQRVSAGGHDIPEEDQLRRHPRSLANFEKAFAFFDEALVFDNSTPKGHIRVVEKNKQGVIFFGELPAWAEFLEKYR